MAEEPKQVPPLFTQYDVSPRASTNRSDESEIPHAEMVALLQDILAAQDRQNQLMEELVTQLGATQKQRASELSHWKQLNPHLSEECHSAAERLSQAQTEYLRGVTEEVNGNGEGLVESDFLLNEFVDRFGPRLAHLNGVLQILSQLGQPTNPPKTND